MGMKEWFDFSLVNFFFSKPILPGQIVPIMLLLFFGCSIESKYVCYNNQNVFPGLTPERSRLNQWLQFSLKRCRYFALDRCNLKGPWCSVKPRFAMTQTLTGNSQI